MKKFMLLVSALLTLALLVGCGNSDARKEESSEAAAARAFLSGGYFGIADKTGLSLYFGEGNDVHISESIAQSSFRKGTWEYADGVLTITETFSSGVESVYRFRIEDEALVYIAEGSDNFGENALADGDKLTKKIFEKS